MDRVGAAEEHGWLQDALRGVSWTDTRGALGQRSESILRVMMLHTLKCLKPLPAAVWKVSALHAARFVAGVRVSAPQALE